MPCRYISGENVEQETVKITAPVLTSTSLRWEGWGWVDGKRRNLKLSN